MRAVALDQIGVFGKFGLARGDQRIDGLARVVPEMPLFGDNVGNEPFDHRRIIELIAIDFTQVPLDEDFAHVPDDGRYRKSHDRVPETTAPPPRRGLNGFIARPDAGKTASPRTGMPVSLSPGAP